MGCTTINVDELRAERTFQMNVIESTDDELRLLHNALHAYLNDFGHDEADVLREVKRLIAKLPPLEN